MQLDRRRSSPFLPFLFQRGGMFKVVRSYKTLCASFLVSLFAAELFFTTEMEHTNSSQKHGKNTNAGFNNVVTGNAKQEKSGEYTKMDIDSNGSARRSRHHNIVRLVAISDTHGLHEHLSLPPGDILIHCGDFADRGSVSDITSFRNWLSQQTQFRAKVLISGNHDRDLRNPNRLDLKHFFQDAKDDNIHFLQDETFVYAGGQLHIHGASWETCEADTFFLPWNREPSVDVFLSHVPPFLPETRSRKWHWSKRLSKLIRGHQIPICLSGHFHWARGAVQVTNSRNFTSSFINCSSKKEQSQEASMQRSPVFPPVVIDYNTQDRCIANLEGLEQQSIAGFKSCFD